MTPIQPRGPKAHSDIDLKMAAEHLSTVDDDYLTGLSTALSNLDRALGHSDITSEEFALLTSARQIASALLILRPSASTQKIVREYLAKVCLRLAKVINKRESDYGHGLRLLR